MKNPAAGLNGQAIKRFFLAHFEKMIFGVCLLIAIWACTQNRWLGYEQVPQALSKNVDDAAKVLRDSPWPESERKTITSYRFIEQAQKVTQTSNWEKFAIEDLYWPLYPRKMQAGEPEWMPIESLEVSSGQALIALKSKTPEGTPADAKPGTTPAGAKPATPSVAGTKDGKAPAGGTLDAPKPTSLPGIGEITKDSSAPAAGGGLPPALTGGNMANFGIGGFGGFGGGAGGFRMDRSAAGDDSATTQSSGLSNQRISIQGGDGRGYRFAAVRGVFPLQDQLRSFVRAHLAENIVAASLSNPQLFSPIEFQVERQEAVPGDDPWSGKWERLDLANSIKLLEEEVAGLEPESIDQQYVDYTIAMPVPARVFGTWSKELLGHSRISQLNEEQLAKQKENAEKLLKEQELVAKEQAVMTKRKGFSRVANSPAVLQKLETQKTAVDNGFTPQQEEEDDDNDERRAKRRRRGGASNTTQPANAGTVFGGQPGVRQPARQPGQPTGVVQAYVGPEVLLFRYFDFDVEPGRTYRYRVRLLVSNPSFGKTLAEVTEPFVMEGETRETPWSAESEPVKIPDDYQLYLLLVSDKGPGNQRVAFKIYEWEPTIGTRVLGEIRKVEFGQVVGGLAKTPVLRLTKQTLQDEQVELRTRDVLLDVRESPTIVPSEHPDLEFADVKNLARPIKIGVPSSAVLGNQFGEFELKDQESGKEGLQKAEGEASMVNKFFDYLKSNKDKIKPADGGDNPFDKKDRRRGGGGLKRER